MPLSPTRRSNSLRITVSLIWTLTLVHASAAPPPTPDSPLVIVRHGAFMLAGRPLPYLHGINYEGPPDRPWRMWQDGLFDPALIARDFDAIAAAGYNPVRIFIRYPLPRMILDGDFSRLDTVTALAAARGLRLLITLNDDGDPDLRRVARVDGLIAAHLAGNPGVFGYDLRNEPNLVDIAASIYPAGAPLPLLSPALIGAYHERVTMAAARKAHRGGAWSGGGFAAFDTRKLYYYLNARAVLSAFLRANPAYPDVPAAPYWTPFLDLANRTLASYLYAQLTALRAADPTHLTTVGYASRFWAALAANGALGFRSIHIYPPADFDGFHAALRRFEALDALASSPLVLEEYGVSNALAGPRSSAVREMAVALYLRTLGGGGDIKWMFDDDAVGYNAYENNLGAVDARGRPKPTYRASAAADAYWAHAAFPGGLVLRPDPVTSAGFVYVARDGLAIGGSLPYANARLRYEPRGAGVTWLDWSTPGLLRVTSTTSATLTVALGALTGATALLSSATTASISDTNTLAPATATSPPSSMFMRKLPRVAVGEATATISPPAAPASSAITATAAAPAVTPTATETPTVTAVPSPPTALPTPAAAPLVTTTGSLTITLTLQAGVPQLLAYRAAGPLPSVPIDLPAPPLAAGWYVVARGHNVAPPFLAPWLSLGGTAGIGLPVTEAFAYHGLPTQYFDDVALRMGPRGLTTAPIGVVALNGARPPAPELPARVPHLYDRVTGHNIHGFFLDYWRRHGGLSFWGDPLTEEIQENGRLVQYFSGAELALVRTAGAHVDVALLPLGRRMWPIVRAVYGL